MNLEQTIAEIFNRNLGNKLSPELANGMYAEIMRVIQEAQKEKEEVNADVS